MERDCSIFTGDRLQYFTGDGLYYSTVIALQDDVVDSVTETSDWFDDLRLVKLLFEGLKFEIPSWHHAVHEEMRAHLECNDTVQRDGHTGQDTDDGDQDSEADSLEHGETRSSNRRRSCGRVRM